MTTTPTRFRPRPITVEARQLLGCDDGHLPQEVATWCGGSLAGTYDDPKLILDGPRGTFMVARCGDWIVREPSGTVRVLAPDAFAATYEPAEAAARAEGGA